MELDTVELTLLKFISKRFGRTRIANITSHFMGSIDRENRELAFNSLVDKNLIKMENNHVELTEPGVDFITQFDLYEHEEVHNGYLQFAILKFLNELDDAIGLDYLPNIFKSNAPADSSSSDEMNLINYLEFNSNMKQFIKKTGNHQYEISNEGKVKYQNEITKRQASNTITKQTIMKQVTTDMRTVFIIHGHNEAMKKDVQLFLTRADLNEIVLHEKPDLGRTVIDKLVQEGESANYVIALLSPDDLQDDGTVRARQNVILEIGYFMGKLGIKYVRLLKSGGTAIPSDLSGILYEDYDTNGNWRIKLAKEMSAVGVPINVQNIIDKF